MHKANQILQAIRKMGIKRIPLTRVYRSLYCEELYLAAYDKIRRNEGALTPGTSDDTADGFSISDVHKVIDLLRHERFYFRPSRRTQIPKKSKGTRPLGIPDFTEKLVQEVLRMILEAYYEPRFRNSSHGFRPERGCHTALTQLKQKFVGTTWFIEGDIKGCFDNISHEVLISILSRDIHDGRLLNLIQRSLEAGYIEDWLYHKTYSGTPQGGVLSPILSNIVLHELDTYIEDELIPRFSRGKQREINRDYKRMSDAIWRAQKKGDMERAENLIQQRRQIPSVNTHDPNFRRLKYIRYADDFILGFIGPKSEAQAIKTAIGTFLKEKLHLTMSDEKTLITHARTEYAQFLGYAVSVQQANDKMTRSQSNGVLQRSINGIIRLGIPSGLVKEHIKRYYKRGKVAAEPTLLVNSDAHIIETFQRRFRGLAEYYKYAVDRKRLQTLKYVMELALVRTLASKFKTRIKKIYRKYHSTMEVDGFEYKTLAVEVPTERGTSLIYWGAVPLKVVKVGYDTIRDEIPFELKLSRTDLVQRLQANTCELCGSHEKIQVHHVRKLSNLKHRWAGRKQKPEWVVRMIAIRRKTLVVCHKCHVDIHAGRPIPKSRRQSSGEPCAVKAASTVRRGDCEKVS